MAQEYIGFWLCNLLVPGDPEEFSISTPSGEWKFRRHTDFSKRKPAIEQGQCAETYSAGSLVTIGPSRSASMDATFGELLPLCLGASYLTCLSVKPTRGVPMSSVNFLQVGPHFPRERAMGWGNPAINSLSEFKDALERFVRQYQAVERTEKARLLIHHWLDALACWSLEDLVLSTATMLEIIAATAATVSVAAGMPLKAFQKRIDHAATRFALPLVPASFRSMRNDLVHEGTLSGSKFPNKTVADCSAATAETLNWLDLYIHAAFGLGVVRKPRFTSAADVQVNSFSL